MHLIVIRSLVDIVWNTLDKYKATLNVKEIILDHLKPLRDLKPHNATGPDSISPDS